MPELKPEPVGLASYVENATRRLYAFALGSDGNLYVNYWNGAQWAWANRDHPPGVEFLGQASEGVDAVTYTEGNKQRIYAFASQGQLYVNFWNGSQWQWADQGKPDLAGGVLGGAVSAITYEQGGTQRIYAFAQGSLDWNHFANYWNGSKWQWADLGMPPNAQGELGPPHVITYVDEAGKRRIYDFASSGPAGGGAGRLYVNYWDGDSWHWADQGTPGSEPGSSPSVITTWLTDPRPAR